MKSVHIGVDVFKDKLDVYVPAAKEGARPATTGLNLIRIWNSGQGMIMILKSRARWAGERIFDELPNV